MQGDYYMRCKPCRAKIAFVSNAGFSSAQEEFGGARVGWVFIRSGLPDSKKVPPFYLIDSFAATGKWSEGYSVFFARGAPTSEDLSRITQ